MEVEVSIGISARHLHLNAETYAKLFDHDLTVKSNLNQIGQFAANETVTLKSPKGTIENVRIIGPLRNYNQVEISMTDARKLGLNPPVRRSGDVAYAEKITVETPKGSVDLDNCIIANRHVHMNPEKASELGVVNRDILSLEIDNEKRGIIDVEVTITDNGYFEVHLDTDDANAFLLQNGSKGKLKI